MLRRLYDWTISLAASRHALWALAIVAFVESSVFPIPPHLLLIPMVIAAPRRAWVIAGVCTVASVLGGILGYYIGAALFTQIGLPVLEFYGKAAAFDTFAAKFNEVGAWAVLFAGLTPFPYKVITITSGATGLHFGTFMLASVIARGTIFFVIAGLLRVFGEPIRGFIEKRLGLVFTLFCILLIGGFYVVKYL